MKFNAKLSLTEFGNIAEMIAEKYFDEDGKYTPHVGLANAMCVFYNQCVIKDGLPSDFPEYVNSIIEIEPIVANDKFISAFNRATEWDVDAIDFANAYHAALDMVEAKKTSVGYIVDVLASGIAKIAKSLEENMSPEMADNMKKIVTAMGDGNNLAEAIVKEYGNLNLVR